VKQASNMLVLMFIAGSLAEIGLFGLPGKKFCSYVFPVKLS
jgi:hypothetical protein